MDVLDRFARSGIVPVVVLDDAADAADTARALLAGGVDVMEITFRTAAAPEAIARVAAEVPEMLVGAGTVITLEQCKQAVACGAKFIVAPGYDEEVVSWCCEQGIPVTPGCVTPTEIMMALKHGLQVLKFFPANVYGGLNALKALAGPFGSVKFIPTGGVNAGNIAEFAASPAVHAVGGSWVCPKADIAAHDFEKITRLCEDSRRALLGFELAHVGLNCADEAESSAVADTLGRAFGFPKKVGNSSIFAGTAVEAMKEPFLGANGHIGIRTNKIEAAVAEMERRGFALRPETAKYKGGRMTAVYLADEVGGFALHLIQK
ncbi:MAG: bifunctional 4-hydroxy-2-oxoglutarate aldolase/2-dehydro-3-deoxy-phosphogluconate aldolase [Oscillospiraceae bacterium]|nr:bifunctional 4-hydroxy-2-oxoglutarate aldolase/2-dehydro-3-deoxy-phosphogluconate aldolase [Oscillospiraceae bacterium]